MKDVLTLLSSPFSSPDTFMVEDAVEAIGFGRFQWKLSVLTGLAWVRAQHLVYPKDPTATQITQLLPHIQLLPECQSSKLMCGDGPGACWEKGGHGWPISLGTIWLGKWISLETHVT